MSPRWSSRSACSAPIRRRSWPSARRVRIRGPGAAGQAAARAAAARWRGRRRPRPRAGVGGAILLLDALFLGLLFGGGSAGATARPHSSREPIDLGGPARHLHAALQHGPDRWPAGLLPRRAARIRRGRVASTTVGILTATYFLAELVLSPPFGYLSDRYGAHRIMQIGPIFGVVAVLITAVTVNLWAHWRHAPAGGRRGRGLHPVDPGLHRAGDIRRPVDPRPRGLALRGRHAAGHWLRHRRRRANLRRHRPRRLRDQCGYLRPVVHLSLGRGRAAPRAGIGRRGGRPGGRPQRLDLGRYRRILGSSRVWLLAPTWIALNAVLGSWTTQSVFQLVRDPPPGSATSC